MAVRTRELPATRATGSLEPVAYFEGPMPTGVTVSHQGRIFVNFPKWGDRVDYTVAEIRDGHTVPYPDQATNQPASEDSSQALVSVQSVVVDPADRLWILDTGSPLFRPTSYGGPKLVCVDLSSNQVVRTILFPQTVALPTTYLNDVRFDLRRGDEGLAFVTDSSDQGPNGIIVVDLASGESWRRLHDHPSTKAEPLANFVPVVEGRPLVEHRPDGTMERLLTIGADGIAIGADGNRLYYCPLVGRQLYSVDTDALADRSLDDATVAETVIHEGDKGGAGDGLESDATGCLYATNYEHNAVLRRRPGRAWETVAHDPHLLWPDTLSVARDGHLYVTANQLHRQAAYQQQDLRSKPYTLFRVRIDARPVLLR